MAHTVVVTQPGGAGSSPSQPRDWNSGIFGCFEDVCSCFTGLCCPCALGVTIARDLGESPAVPVLVPYWPIVLRTRLRSLYNIEGSILKDCLMTQCCLPCMLCQMKREIDHVMSRQ